VALDSFHQSLLNAEDEESLILGLLSVVFWGYVSGADGRINANRALSKCRVILFGRKNAQAQRAEEIVAHLRRSRDLLRSSQISDALREAQEVKFLGMSFASKVLTFMNPTIGAVYDDVISQRHRTHCDPEIRSMFVATGLSSSKQRQEQCDVYGRWCHWCLKMAGDLNTRQITWTDWDGSEHKWRAVDIERAFFALGR
jgi:hypothetical protein